jgi:hypothetical protein
MGFPTTAAMTLGMFVGWGVLSPLAKHSGWAPGPVGDSTHGSRGWILWVALAIMVRCPHPLVHVCRRLTQACFSLLDCRVDHLSHPYRRLVSEEVPGPAFPAPSNQAVPGVERAGDRLRRLLGRRGPRRGRRAPRTARSDVMGMGRACRVRGRRSSDCLGALRIAYDQAVGDDDRVCSGVPAQSARVSLLPGMLLFPSHGVLIRLTLRLQSPSFGRDRSEPCLGHRQNLSASLCRPSAEQWSVRRLSSLSCPLILSHSCVAFSPQSSPTS